MNSPLKLIEESQKAARDTADGNARFCQLATVDAEGAPRVRSVIMHDVTEQYIGCIFSKYHGKARHLEANGKFQVYVWHPTQGNQFMVNGVIEPMPHERLQRYWDNFLSIRSKHLDLFYTTGVERRPAEVYPDRESLEKDYWEHVLKLETTQDELKMPDHVIGAHFLANRVEHLKVSDHDGRFHRRTLYRRDLEGWQSECLVP
ncbi:MAG: pyridoxamine 5'-phosphate oxidase family protein [Verrucomicrobiota bacterium]